MTTLLPSQLRQVHATPRRLSRWLLTAVLIWAATVVVLAHSGALAHVVGPQFALLVALGIACPTALYYTVPAIAAEVREWGLKPLSVIHIWRAPAALLFFQYGLQGALPTLFWVIAGVGDLLVGLYAMRLLRGEADRRFYQRLHVIGFIDFVVAVGLGLTYTLLGDPRMALLATLPMALIPLFGVALSGASHLVSFDLLRRGAGGVTAFDARRHSHSRI